MDLGFGQSRCWVVKTSLFQKAIRAISNLAPNRGYHRRLLRRSGDRHFELRQLFSGIARPAAVVVHRHACRSEGLPYLSSPPQ